MNETLPIALPLARIRLMVLLLLIAIAANAQKPGYVCPPCGCANDGKVFESPGSCTACSMKLLNSNNKSEGLNYRNLEPQEVCNLVDENPAVIFLDVRTEQEFRNSTLGRIKGAKHIHVNDLEKRVEELAEYKEKEIVVYCLIGIRSARASEFLTKNGFTHVNNMLGGMNLWNELTAKSLQCKNELLEK